MKHSLYIWHGIGTATLILAGPANMAVAATLNDTGITKCIALGGKLTSNCQGSQQDGGLGRDIDAKNNNNGIVGFNFRKVCNSGQRAGDKDCSANASLGTGPNDWACTYDKVTGLTWEIKTLDGYRSNKNVFSLSNVKETYVAQVNSDRLCNYSDWRLPSVSELQSIVNYGNLADSVVQPPVDTKWLPNTSATDHWVNSPNPAVEAHAMAMTTGFLRVDDGAKYKSVQLVRGPAYHGEKRFVINGGEATDLITGLTWKRCLEPATFVNDTCVGPTQLYDYFSAIDRAKNASEGDGKAWRVPNVKELGSIVNLTYQNPTLNTKVFLFGGNTLITSSPYILDNNYDGRTFRVSFFLGTIAPSASFDHLLLVRN